MRLSVIIPAYMSERTIEECLRSILASDFKDYEVIVSDDGSTDRTAEITRKYPCEVLVTAENKGDAAARNRGAMKASGDVLVFIDSDVVIRHDTLGKISSFLEDNATVDAVVGLLSKFHPNNDFFSQYKNIYMNYIFENADNPIDFIFTSISAIRKKSFLLFDEIIRAYNDTELGKRMAGEGKIIILKKDLEVIHLKKYSLASFIKNDFRVSFAWAKIFLKYGSWESVFKKKGFAHAKASQIGSILLAPVMVFLLFLSLADPKNIWLFAAGFLVFCCINIRFLTFLKREKGLFFSLFSSFVTFIDMIVMGLGIFFGSLRYVYEIMKRRGIQPL